MLQIFALIGQVLQIFAFMLQIFALIGQVLQIFALYQNLHSCGLDSLYILTLNVTYISEKLNKTKLKVVYSTVGYRKATEVALVQLTRL